MSTVFQVLRTSAHIVPVASAPKRYEALDSIRGLAACWVFLYHISNGHSWQSIIVQNGHLAVTFFFVLSGFVIGASYGKRLTEGYSISKFMFLRWGRIYPLHAFMIGVMFLYEIIRGLLEIDAIGQGAPFTGQTSVLNLFFNIFMLQGFTLDHVWNKPAWSIGVEFWAYLCCALLLGGLRIRQLTVAGIILALPGGVLTVFGHRLPFEVPHGLTQFLSCCLGFGIGLCVYEMRQWGVHLPDEPRNRLAATLFEVAVVLLALALSWSFGGKLSPLIYPAFAAVIWVFSSQAGYLSRLLLTPPLLMLGTLSYSIYMVHHFIQDRTLDAIRDGLLPLPLTVPSEGRILLVGDPWLCDAVTFGMLVVTVFIAYFTYHYVEEPARKWSRDVANRIGASGKSR